MKYSASVIAVIAAFGATAATAQTDLAALEQAAKAEGMLTTIALPHDWCNYGGVIAAFKEKYPEITVNELNPDASSADELEAIRANVGNTGPQAPDVIDVGLAFGPQAQAEGLIQPYKVATWDDIPADLKDADGHWYADYYGIMAFGVNTDLVDNVPQNWADLLKPEYANSFALTGDPRASNQAILSVMSAGGSRGGAPGEDSGTKGLEFFAELNKAGNFVPVTAKAGTIAQGATPIVAAWNYNLFTWRDQLAGNPPVEVVIPADGVLAGVYVQGISAHAPHPNAAKLWMEHLYSDEGQLGWLQGGCYPARFVAMKEAGLIPQDMLDALPQPDLVDRAVFPTVEQQDALKRVVTENWDNVVGATVSE
ncbi:MAG: ABC transporter substrate-binding protein [Paracoccus sp. (in: a-proteobacteria)]|uniref:ABC transporter substrate-binding protein n=1 Tax=Paracoccus sp. TaxID=267 RepID=UPI0026E03EF3|nr:ABC transporter substrate-binding protein [Paracoccus sp. (in: a-proteobacteria)]MDO5632554.1 ABC transporter substrate-binding protein [Paracoccus sp. (in: a-proteobacteria)]